MIDCPSTFAIIVNSRGLRTPQWWVYSFLRPATTSRYPYYHTRERPLRWSTNTRSWALSIVYICVLSVGDTMRPFRVNAGRPHNNEWHGGVSSVLNI